MNAEQTLVSGRSTHETGRRDVHNDVNVGTGERLASAIGGGTLLLWGIGRRSLPGAVMAVVGGGLLYRGITGHCSVYEALGVRDDDATPASHPLTRGVTGRATTRINLPVEKVYHFWRDFQHLASVMPHIERIDVSAGGRRSHWVAMLPGEGPVEWDAEVTADRENERIAWRTVPGSDLPHEGEVQFRPAERGSGTDVRLQFRYFPPLGAVGAALAKVLRVSPEHEAEEGLWRLKQLLEEGSFDVPAEDRSANEASLLAGNRKQVSNAHQEDIVDEGSDLSFPASDPPSYMPPGHA